MIVTMETLACQAWSGMIKPGITAFMVLVLSLLLIPPAYPAESPPMGTENRAMSLALDASGRPWIAWVMDDGSDTDIYYSRWLGQTWQSPQPLSANPEAWEESPSLAFDAGGTLWAAWMVSVELPRNSRAIAGQLHTGPDQTTILVSHWAGDRWSEPVPVLGTTTLSGRQPALAAAPDGSLWLAWVGHDGTDREIYASHWDGRRWTAPRRVGHDDTDPQAYDTHPRLAVDDTGEVWLAWASYEGPLNDEIHVSHWDGTTWSPQQQVSARDHTPDVWPSLALDADGQPWVAWHGAGMEGSGHWQIYTSHWDAAQSTWSAEVLVSSPPSLELDERRPSLAFDGHNQLHLAWAVAGRLPGIAHATWDGTDWTSPTWTNTSELVEAPVFLDDGKARLLWLTPGASEATPAEQRSVKEMTDPLPRPLPPQPGAVTSESNYVPNRHLAHGDSITCGCYDDLDGQPATPYPTFLERRLDSTVVSSEVINSGKPGEKARAARPRLQETVEIYQPQYLQIMQGTNDVTSNYSAAETAWAVRLLIRDARAELPGIHIVVATLVPRLDHHYELTRETNHQIFFIAGKEHVPVADQWQAFHNYGDWRELFVDSKHPGTTGLHIIADTFFQSMVGAGWLPDDPTPPDAWITSLPPQSECPAVTVAWTGDDGSGTGIASYDVQARDNGGPWIAWLLETPETSGTYGDATPGHSLSFRVRARDQVGNVGDYSAPATTQIVDTTPPESIGVLPLPPYRSAPFTVSWWGYDACSQVTGYDVEYRVGNGNWQRWLTQTPSSNGDFNPSSPQCGRTYSFRVRAYDGLNNRSVWSDGAESTTLACHTVSGSVRNVRETPVASARLSASPDALGADPSNEVGFYTIYFDDAGNYDITVEREGFGVLPARQGVTVAGHVTGVDLILPPADDQVDDGGFEKAGWGNWQRAGSSLPASTATTHTGAGAALLDPDGGDSRLRQSLVLPVSLTEPTLSLMVRLASKTGPASTLRIELAGQTTITEDVAVTSGDWRHIWFDASALVGKTIDLTLAVSGSRAVIVDEISLGSAGTGTHVVYLPLIASHYHPRRFSPENADQQ